MKKNIVFISRIAISLIILFISLFTNFEWYIDLTICLIAFLVISYDVLFEAFRNILHGQIFDENFLMIIASIGAFATREYPEALMVMTLYQVGEWFNKYSVNKSRKAISELMDIKPESATKLVGDELITVYPEEVNVDDIILVKSGEKIPLDGIVIEGNADIDAKSLTGESKLRSIGVNDEAISGTINQNGLLKIKVSKPYNESTVEKIIELVENASDKKGKAEQFITKFAKYYTPIVVILALILGGLMPLFLGDTSLYPEYIHRACSFLVISCPCALVISVPLSYFSGIGGASKLGILIKGSNYIEALAKTKKVCFDKTGTLTKGNFKVTNINNNSNEDILMLAALGETFSNHPIKEAILDYYKGNIDKDLVQNYKEHPGKGLTFNYNNDLILVGNDKLLLDNNILYNKDDSVGTIIYVAKNNTCLGNIVINDEIKPEAINLVKDLHKDNIEAIMLSGDKNDICKNVSDNLSLDKYYSELLPQEKVERLEENLSEKSTLIYVGDGINDAPVLMRADIGISMGQIGSDAAIEASDVVIMDDDISKVETSISLSKRIMRIVYTNIIFAIGIKFLVLILGAFGIASMWLAIFADVGVAMIAILNAMRALNVNKYKK